MNTTRQDKRHTARGGCHCGAVAFEIRLPDTIDVRRCNCSICAACGYQHLTVAKPDFQLLQGAESLSEYTFNTGVARHLFCRVCGIKSFYVPRSHPDAYSINFNCIECPAGVSVEFGDFDGRHWEAHVHELDHLGR